MTELATLSVEQDLVGRIAQAERDLASLQQQLEHAHRLATVGTLAAGIAHEINNIMTPVLAYAQLAKADPHDAALQEKALDRDALTRGSVDRQRGGSARSGVLHHR